MSWLIRNGVRRIFLPAARGCAARSPKDDKSRSELKNDNCFMSDNSHPRPLIEPLTQAAVGFVFSFSLLLLMGRKSITLPQGVFDCRHGYTNKLVITSSFVLRTTWFIFAWAISPFGICDCFFSVGESTIDRRDRNENEREYKNA